MRNREGGSATVEFLAVTVVLLVPIVYLILTFSHVQAATYAAEATAREAGRIFARAEDETLAFSRAHQAAHLAFGDHSIDVTPSEVLQVTCDRRPCVAPEAGVHIRVRLEVPLPLLPEVLARGLTAVVTVSADAYITVDRFGG